MIYLTGVVNDHLNALKAGLGLDLMMGMMVQPGTASYVRFAGYYDHIGIDNGLFSEAGRRNFTMGGYLDLIDELTEAAPGEALWATAPDVVGDWEATLEQSLPSLPPIRDRVGAALVTQDGATSETVPWDEFDCLFVGGSTEWKLSPISVRIMREAKRRGKWVHVGRVNSLKRMKEVEKAGADSCDGTYLAYTDPIEGLCDIVNWLSEVNGPDPWGIDREGLLDWKVRLYGEDPKNYRWFPRLMEAFHEGAGDSLHAG